jgi:hypothetical protein
MSRMVRANASHTTVLSAFLSVPKIIGMGPIMTTPPALTLDLFSPFAVLRVPSRMMAIIMMSMPTNISAMPAKDKSSVGLNFSFYSLQLFTGLMVIINLTESWRLAKTVFNVSHHLSVNGGTFRADDI